jgi:hypothetical protein
LFDPPLVLALGDGWYRRDANSDRKLNLRRSDDLAQDVTFISGIDFIQCGTSKPTPSPDVATVVADLTGSSMLKVSSPVDAPFGDRTAKALKLLGGGAPIPQADFPRSAEFGCILSIGNQPWPAESYWVMATRDAVMQLVLVDVDGKTVLVRSRPSTTSGADTLYDLTLKVLAGSKIG